MAQSACEILELVEGNLNEQGQLFYQWWNFEVLTIASLREMAAEEAATADMILLDLQGGRELPQEVIEWLNRWLALRNDRPGVLAALLNPAIKKPDASQEIILQLKQVAARGHMDFIASRAMEVGRDAELARKVGEVVWHIRHGAPKHCAKRIAGRRGQAIGKVRGVDLIQRR